MVRIPIGHLSRPLRPCAVPPNPQTQPTGRGGPDVPRGRGAPRGLTVEALIGAGGRIIACS